MLLSGIIAILGCQRQPIQDLQPRVLEVPRPVRYLLLEALVLFTQLTMQLLNLQQVTHPQKQLRSN